MIHLLRRHPQRLNCIILSAQNHRLNIRGDASSPHKLNVPWFCHWIGTEYVRLLVAGSFATRQRQSVPHGRRKHGADMAALMLACLDLRCKLIDTVIGGGYFSLHVAHGVILGIANRQRPGLSLKDRFKDTILEILNVPHPDLVLTVGQNIT